MKKTLAVPGSAHAILPHALGRGHALRLDVTVTVHGCKLQMGVTPVGFEVLVCIYPFKFKL